MTNATRGIQAWLSRKTRICQSTVSDIMAGKRRATPEQAIMLEPLLLQKGINLTRIDLVFGYKKGQSWQIDLKAGGDAVGQELTVKAVVGTAFAGGTSLQFKLQTSSDNSTWTDLLMTGAVATADLKAGSVPFDVRVPKGAQRYLRMQYVATGTFTAGTVTAFLTKEL